MHAVDIIVHASADELFGIVGIEAMTLGKPVIAGASGGPLEIVRNRLNGVLVPYGGPKELAEAILDDPMLALRLGRAARERAQEFSVKRYVDELRQQ